MSAATAIAAIVISVLSIAVSGYSFVMTRQAAKAREEADRLRAEREATPWPVIEFTGTVTPETEARLRDALAREWRRAHDGSDAERRRQARIDGTWQP